MRWCLRIPSGQGPVVRRWAARAALAVRAVIEVIGALWGRATARVAAPDRVRTVAPTVVAMVTVTTMSFGSLTAAAVEATPITSLEGRPSGGPRQAPEIRLVEAGAADPSGSRWTATAALAPPLSPQTPAGPVEATVQPGDNFWRLAEGHLEAACDCPITPSDVAPYWLRVISANADRLARPGNPDLIYPGQTFTLPPIDHTAPTVPPASGPRAPSLPPATTGPRTPPNPSGDGPDRSVPSASPDAEATATTGPMTPEDHPPTTTPAGDTSGRSGPERPVTDPSRDRPLLGLPTLVAIGVLMAVTAAAVAGTRANRRPRRRDSGAAAQWANPGPLGDVNPVVDDDAAGQLRRSLARLAAALAAAGSASRPRIVLHDTDHLDVLLDTPARHALDGWNVDADGAVWSCRPLHLAPSDTDESATTTAPLLVPLGQPDGGQLYLDLEAEGVISLTGDRDVVLGVATTIVTEVADSPLGDTAHIIVTGGLATSSLGQLDRVTVIEDPAAAARELHAWAERSHAHLVDHDWANTFLARGQDAHHEALAPLLVVTDHLPDDPTTLAHLLTPTPRAAALVVLSDTPIEGATVIHCTPERLTLPQLDLVCTPPTFDQDQQDDENDFGPLANLLDDADDPTGEQLRLLLDPPDDPADTDPDIADAPATASGAGPYQDPPYDILVRVLGDITIDAPNTRPTPKQTAVLAYIALHRTVTLDRICDALWSKPTPSRRRRIINTVSAARTAIGHQHLPIADGHTYRAGPRLLTDIDLLQRRLAAAETQPPEIAIETLRGALNLVRGPIFSYPSNLAATYTWISTENWISTWELKITALARDLTKRCMTNSDTQQAVDIAQHAHQIIPTDTDLTELLMTAHATNNDRIAVQRVYQAHLQALQQLDLGDPDPSTVNLYNQLRRASG